MIVNCPNCSIGLSLDENIIKDKQVKVRCANCQHIFPVGPVAQRPAGRKAVEDLDLGLDLPDLPDLEEGLDEALASRGGRMPKPDDDLRLDLPDLSELESGLEDDLVEQAPSRPPEPAPEKPKAAPPRPQAPPPPPKKAAPPPLEDDSLGELGDLEDEDLASSEAPAAKAAAKPSALGDEDLGELSDFASEIDDALGAAPPSAEKGEAELGDLGELALGDDLASGKTEALELELPGLEPTETMMGPGAAAKGGEEELSLDLELELPGLEEEKPKAAVRPDVEDEDEVKRALAAIEGPDAGQELTLDLPGAPSLDATMELGLPDLEPEEAAPAPAGGEAGELSLDLDDLGDLGELSLEEEAAPAAAEKELSLDLEEAPAPAAKPAAKDDLGDLGELGDLGDLGDLELDEAAPAEAPAAPSAVDDMAIDLDGFELSMDAAEPETAAAKPAASMDLEFDAEETFDMEPGKPGAKEAPPPPPPESRPSFDAQATMAIDEPFEAVPPPPRPAAPEIEEEEEEAPEEIPEKAAPKKERRARRAFPWRAILAAAVIILILAGLAILAARILYRPAPPPQPAAVDTQGAVYLSIAENEVEAHLESNQKEGPIVVVVGQLTNKYKEARGGIQVEGELYDSAGKQIEGVEIVYCGNTPSAKEMRTLSADELSKRLENPAGDDNRNLVVPPGGKIPFTIIFYDVPKNVAEVVVVPIKSGVAGTQPAAGKPGAAKTAPAQPAGATPGGLKTPM